MYPYAVSISSDLLSHLSNLYFSALKDVVLRNQEATNINGQTKFAVPAYIIAVAAVEAFVNEMFLSPSGRKFLKNAPTNAAYWQALENSSLLDKLVFVPQIFFGRTFENGQQPYQDMKELISLRNELTHYKMGFKQPACVKNLQQRKIALQEKGHTWTSSVSTLEGMRWARNTACLTIKSLGSFATQETHSMLAIVSQHGSYTPWTDEFVRQKARELLSTSAL
jgi:hypothetical protein